MELTDSTGLAHTGQVQKGNFQEVYLLNPRVRVQGWGSWISREGLNAIPCQRLLASFSLFLPVCGWA